MTVRRRSRLTLLSPVLIVAVCVSCVESGDSATLHEALRGHMASSLSTEAAKLDLTIDTETLAVSAVGSSFAAMVAVERSEPGFARPGPIALLQLSLSPSLGCATLSTGFYTLRLSEKNSFVPREQLEPGETKLTVDVVDASGNVVAQEQFTHSVMRMAPEDAPSDDASPRVEVQIKEKMAGNARIIIISGHVKSHHEFAGWQWWEWTEVTIV